MDTPETDQGYTIKQAAERLQLAEVTVRKMLRSGRLTGHLASRKHGLTWIITDEDLRRYHATEASPIYPVPHGDLPRSLEDKLSRIDERSTRVLDEIKVLQDTMAQLQQEITHLQDQANRTPTKPQWFRWIWFWRR